MATMKGSRDDQLSRLQEQCRSLECRCAGYVKELERAHEDLEKQVVQRTSEIRVLKDRLQAENVFLKQELADNHTYGTIIGESNAIRSVVSQIELVAPTDATVLIQGESGTGKELIAHEIHRHSNRRHHPLIKVNCATIPKDLYESEFFGHIRGAFTGALADRMGRFEAADGGTIFLDEVGEIPIDLQSKLLRVLQEGEYERLGEERTRKVDVRIIAATNKDLREEVRAKRFRDDLFYRLNVFPIQIAPLRERKEDIPLLAIHFVRKLSEELNTPSPPLTEANIQDLRTCDWPGNVRELRNSIERAMILCRSKPIRFNLSAEGGGKAGVTAGASKTDDRKGEILTDRRLKALEKENMIRALEHCNWKIYADDGAAALLGINPTTLIERMKRMKIRRPDSPQKSKI